jgi:ATP adenylyltransferase
MDLANSGGSKSTRIRQIHPFRIRFRPMPTTADDTSKASDENLRRTVERVALRALADGALQPIATSVHHVTQRGVRFVVRRLAGAAGHAAVDARSQRATTGATHAENPFLPYDPALFVTDLSPTHVCLLNKYPVVDHHLLIVTRTFAPQEEQLNEADFAALLSCARQLDGLAFYNAGKTAGASQRHKHLQLAPFPLDPTGVSAPILPALGAPAALDEIVHSPHLSFRHALVWLSPAHATDAAHITFLYTAMLRAVGVWGGGASAPRPYNWLATRQWMLMAPRRAETVADMAVNGLGFAGSLLVRNQEQLAWLQAYGPLDALRAVSEPLETDLKIIS